MLRRERGGGENAPAVGCPSPAGRAAGPPGGKPGLGGLLGWVDQTVLWLMRTRGHFEPLETAMRALGAAGEWALVWTALGAAGAGTDSRRRSRWLAATVVGPAAIG